MKYCAEKEMKKARGELPMKTVIDLVMIKSMRNQLRDTVMQWKNSFNYIAWSLKSKPKGKDDD